MNSWELNAKPMPTLYQGLSAKSTLKSLTVKSPAQRQARPVCLVPPMPSLQALRVTDLDPLNYPDDFSLLLLESKRLEELNLHWSPRMREQGEPSVNLGTLLGRCIAAGYQMQLKRIGLQNLYAMNHGELYATVSVETIERISFLNVIDSKNPKTIFFDRTWIHGGMKQLPKHLKMMRGDGVDRSHAERLSHMSGLEELYFISKDHISRNTTPKDSAANGNASSGVSPSTPRNSQPPTPSRSPEESVALASDYLAVLTQHHSQTLRKVLLSDQWHLGQSAVSNLLRSCPNLEQLGLALEDGSPSSMRSVMPLAPNL